MAHGFWPDDELERQKARSVEDPHASGYLWRCWIVDSYGLSREIRVEGRRPPERIRLQRGGEFKEQAAPIETEDDKFLKSIGIKRDVPAVRDDTRVFRLHGSDVEGRYIYREA